MLPRADLKPPSVEVEREIMAYQCVICCASRNAEQAALRHGKQKQIVCSKCIDRPKKVAIQSIVAKPRARIEKLRAVSPNNLYLRGDIEVLDKVYNVIVSPSAIEVLTAKAHETLASRGGSAVQHIWWVRTYAGGRVRFVNQATNELKGKDSGVSMTDAIAILVRLRPFKRRFALLHAYASFRPFRLCSPAPRTCRAAREPSLGIQAKPGSHVHKDAPFRRRSVCLGLYAIEAELCLISGFMGP